MRIRDERGVALMLVFWMIIVLGAAAAALVAAARVESGVVVNLRARAHADAAARSGVAYATAELRRVATETATPQELAYLFARLRRRLEAAGEIAVGGGRFQVTVVDLNARIDLNVANGPTLRALFARFTNRSDAAAIVAALEDWKDPDDAAVPGGAEAAEYAAAGSPFLPPNRPLATVDELRHVRGMNDELAGRIAPYVTVWGDGAVDVNMAPEPVLAALPGVGADLARALVAQRTGAGLFRTFGEATSFLASGGTSGVGLVGVRATIAPTRLLIVSRGWEPGHPLTREVQAAIELRGFAPGRAPQVLLRHWSERDR